MRAGYLFAAVGFVAFGFVLGRLSSQKTEVYESDRVENNVGPFAAVTDDSSTTIDGSSLDADLQAEQLKGKVSDLTARLRSWTSPHAAQDPLEIGRILIEAEETLDRASESDLHAMMSEWNVSEIPRELVDSVYGRMAEISPETAGALLLDQFRLTTSLSGASGFLKEWVRQDPAAAEEWVDTNATPETKNRLLGAFLVPLASVHPNRAADRVSEMTDEGGILSGVVGRIVNHLKVEDLPRFADRFSVPGKTKWGENPHLRAVLAGWTKKNSVTLVEWILEQPDENIGKPSVFALASSLVVDDFPATARALETDLGTNGAAAELAGEIWVRWLAEPGGLDEALEWFVEHGENFVKPSGGSSLASMQMYWSQEKKLAVLERISDTPESPSKSLVVGKLLQEISRKDPEVTLNYAAEHLPIGRETDSLVAYALGNWASSGGKGDAVQWAMENMPAGDGRVRAAMSAVWRWGEKDPVAAIAYAKSLPQAEREPAMGQVARNWAGSDPHAAWHYIQNSDDPTGISKITSAYFREIVGRNGGSRSLDEARSLPDDGRRADAFSGLFAGWAEIDPASAANALNDLERGPIRDRAIGSFSRLGASADPEAAFIWSLEIDNPEQRRESAVGSGKRWLRADNENARRWIAESTDIPETIRSELLSSGE